MSTAIENSVRHHCLEVFDESEFLKDLNKTSYGIFILLGMGKSFKTGTAIQFWDYCPDISVRPKALVGYKSADLFPSKYNVRTVTSLYQAIAGEYIQQDDMSLWFNSRDKNAILQKITSILSHKKNLLVGTAQNSANIDIGLFRDQRIVMCFKQTDPICIRYDRSENQIYSIIANRKIKDWSRKLDLNPLYFTYIPSYDELLYLPHVPTWYGEDISHAHRDTVINEKGLVM